MPENFDIFEEIVRLRGLRVPLVLCTVVRTAGSTPRKLSARMLVAADGSLVGTVGGGRIEKEVIDAARAMLKVGPSAGPRLLRYHLTHELGMCCGGEMEIFVEPIFPEPLLVVCGGGHVGSALMPLCRPLGFVPILVEDMEELGNPERFPDAARIIDSFEVGEWKDVPLSQGTYVVILTRDHKTDQALLEQLLPYDLSYLGVIGSRRKLALFRQRLEHRGFARERLARVRGPIGLPIGAQTPSEIAIAIMAELIKVRAEARGERLGTLPDPSAAAVENDAGDEGAAG